VFCKDDRGWLRLSVTNPMAIHALECHAWHSTSQIAILISVVAIELVECHARGIRQARLLF
jgi:hypothetical protein